MFWLDQQWLGIAVWVVVFLLSVIIELSGPQLVSLWFAGGAFITLLVVAFVPGGIPFYLQFILFVAISGILLAITKPLFKKYIVKGQKTIPTNASALIGQEIRVLQSTDLHHPGKGIFKDVLWTLVVETSDVFQKDEYAIIAGINGNKLVIQKKQKEGKSK